MRPRKVVLLLIEALLCIVAVRAAVVKKTQPSSSQGGSSGSSNSPPPPAHPTPSPTAQQQLPHENHDELTSTTSSQTTTTSAPASPSPTETLSVSPERTQSSTVTLEHPSAVRSSGVAHDDEPQPEDDNPGPSRSYSVSVESFHSFENKGPEKFPAPSRPPNDGEPAHQSPPPPKQREEEPVVPSDAKVVDSVSSPQAQEQTKEPHATQEEPHAVDKVESVSAIPDVDEDVEEETVVEEPASQGKELYKAAQDFLWNHSSTYEDRRKAVALFHEAAKVGYPRAYWDLAVLYANGVGVRRSQAKAMLFHTLADHHGIPESSAALALRYTKGYGTPRNYERAINYAKTAANAVFVADRYHLHQPQNFELIRSVSTNVEDEVSLAFWKRFWRTSPSSSSSPRSSSTEVVSKDVIPPVWMHEAEKDVRLKLKLGKIYAYGLHGVTPNAVIAKQYLEEAISANVISAYGVLGQMYLTGVKGSTEETSLARNPGRAIEILEKGVQENDVHSINAMGYLYSVGVPKRLAKDLKKAAVMFENARRKGSFEAKYNIAVMKLNGIGGYPQDIPGAMQYLSEGEMVKNFHASWQLGHLYANPNLASMTRNAFLSRNLARALQHFSLVLDYGSWTRHMQEAKRAYRHGDLPNALLHCMYLAETGNAMGLTNAAIFLFLEEPSEWESLFEGRPPSATEETSKTLQENEPEEEDGKLEYLRNTTLDHLGVLLDRMLRTTSDDPHVQFAHYMIGELYRRDTVPAVLDEDDNGLPFSTANEFAEERTLRRLRRARQHYTLAQEKVPQATFNVGVIQAAGSQGSSAVLGPAIDVLHRLWTHLLGWLSSLFGSGPETLSAPTTDVDGPTHVTPSEEAASAEADPQPVQVEATPAVSGSEPDFHLAKRNLEKVLRQEPNAQLAVQAAIMTLNAHWWYLHFERVHPQGFWGSVRDGLLPKWLRNLWYPPTFPDLSPSTSTTGTPPVTDSAEAVPGTVANTVDPYAPVWSLTTAEKWLLLVVGILAVVVETVKHLVSLHEPRLGRRRRNPRAAQQAAAGAEGAAAEGEDEANNEQGDDDDEGLRAAAAE